MSTEQSSPAELRRLIEVWQQPMYNLALRMTGNEADAADATQEIFAILLKNLHRYDSTRPFKPWIYRLASNVVLKYLRDSRLRKRHEVAAMEQDFGNRHDDGETKEDRIEIRRQISRLPEELKAPVVLHYYQGMSIVEVAEILDVPRTTLQSRLSKALESLKTGLTQAGFAAVIPSLEDVMRTSPPAVVPAQLEATLLSLSVPSATVAASGVSMGIGGIIMTKKIVLTLAMTALLALSVGLVVGKTLLVTRDRSAAPPPVPSPAEGEDLRNRLASAEGRLRTMEGIEAVNAELTRRLKGAEEKLALAANDNKSKPPRKDDHEKPPASKEDEKKAKETLLQEARLCGRYAALAHKWRTDKAGLPPSTESELDNLAREAMAIQARRKSLPTNWRAPLDPEARRFNAEIGWAFMEESGILLRKEQYGEYEHFINGFIADGEKIVRDPATSLMEKEVALIRHFQKGRDEIRKLLDAQQASSVETINGFDDLMAAMFPEMGVAGEVVPLDEVIEKWARKLRLNDFETRTITHIVERHIAEYEKVRQTVSARFPAEWAYLEEHGSPEFGKLNYDLFLPFLELQSRAENEIQGFLSPEKQELLRTRLPKLWILQRKN